MAISISALQKKQSSAPSISTLYKKSGIDYDTAINVGRQRNEIFNEQFAREQLLKNALEETKKYEAEAEKIRGSLLYKAESGIVGTYNLGKDIAKAVASTGAGIADIGERGLGVRKQIEGVKNIFQKEKGEKISEAYKRGKREYDLSPTYFERVTGKSLTKEDGGVDWEQGRKFITSSMEAPLYAFNAGVVVGKTLLQRSIARVSSKYFATQVGAGASLQTAGEYKEGDTAGETASNFGKNLVLNAVLYLGGETLQGEIARKVDIKKAKESLSNIESKIGKLDDTDRLNALDALESGVPEEKLIKSIEKIKNEEVSADDLAKKLNDIVDYSPENPNSLSKKIVSEKDPEKIAPLLKGKIAPEDIPTVARLLKNVETEESANAILKKFDPDIQNQKLVEDISFAETPEQVARFLKGKTDDKTIKELSPILAEIRDEGDIKRMLDDFGVKAKSLETKIDDVAKKVEEPKPEQAPKEAPKETPKPKQPPQEEALIAEARKYKTEEEFLKNEIKKDKKVNELKDPTQDVNGKVLFTPEYSKNKKSGYLVELPYGAKGVNVPNDSKSGIIYDYYSGKSISSYDNNWSISDVFNSYKNTIDETVGEQTFRKNYAKNAGDIEYKQIDKSFVFKNKEIEGIKTQYIKNKETKKIDFFSEDGIKLGSFDTVSDGVENIGAFVKKQGGVSKAQNYLDTIALNEEVSNKWYEGLGDEELKKAFNDIYIPKNENPVTVIKNSVKQYPGLKKDAYLAYRKSQLSSIYKKAQETPKTKQTPKPEVKPKQTTFQSLPKKNLELIETTKKIKSKSGQKMLKKVLGDLEAEVKDMPEYGGMDMKEQAEKALRLAIDDYDYAYRIAMGLENAPKGIKVGSIFNAVKRIAIEKGDIDTLIALGTSPEMNAFKKALGQEVKAFDDTMTDDPTRVIDGIIKAQKEQIANADDLIKAEEKKLKEAINKTRTSPESFINNILC